MNKISSILRKDYEEYDFSTEEELYNTKIIKGWTKLLNDTFDNVRLKRCSISDEIVTSNGYFLMCEYIQDNEPMYCVAGFLSNLEGVEDLPRFNFDDYKQMKS